MQKRGEIHLAFLLLFAENLFCSFDITVQVTRLKTADLRPQLYIFNRIKVITIHIRQVFESSVETFE